MKRWPRVSSPALIPSTANATMSGSSVSVPNVAPMAGNRRTPPRERARLGRLFAPAHRLRPRECLHPLGHDLGDHLDRGPARLLDHRQVEVALLVGHYLGLADRFEPGGAQKSLDRALRRAHARAF